MSPSSTRVAGEGGGGGDGALSPAGRLPAAQAREATSAAPHARPGDGAMPNRRHSLRRDSLNLPGSARTKRSDAQNQNAHGPNVTGRALRRHSSGHGPDAFKRADINIASARTGMNGASARTDTNGASARTGMNGASIRADTNGASARADAHNKRRVSLGRSSLPTNVPRCNVTIRAPSETHDIILADGHDTTTVVSVADGHDTTAAVSVADGHDTTFVVSAAEGHDYSAIVNSVETLDDSVPVNEIAPSHVHTPDRKGHTSTASPVLTVRSLSPQRVALPAKNPEHVHRQEPPAKRSASAHAVPPSPKRARAWRAVMAQLVVFRACRSIAAHVVVSVARRRWAVLRTASSRVCCHWRAYCARRDMRDGVLRPPPADYDTLLALAGLAEHSRHSSPLPTFDAPQNPHSPAETLSASFQKAIVNDSGVSQDIVIDEQNERVVDSGASLNLKFDAHVKPAVDTGVSQNIESNARGECIHDRPVSLLPSPRQSASSDGLCTHTMLPDPMPTAFAKAHGPRAHHDDAPACASGAYNVDAALALDRGTVPSDHMLAAPPAGAEMEISFSGRCDTLAAKEPFLPAEAVVSSDVGDRGSLATCVAQSDISTRDETRKAHGDSSPSGDVTVSCVAQDDRGTAGTVEETCSAVVDMQIDELNRQTEAVLAKAKLVHTAPSRYALRRAHAESPHASGEASVQNTLPADAPAPDPKAQRTRTAPPRSARAASDKGAPAAYSASAYVSMPRELEARLPRSVAEESALIAATERNTRRNGGYHAVEIKTVKHYIVGEPPASPSRHFCVDDKGPHKWDDAAAAIATTSRAHVALLCASPSPNAQPSSNIKVCDAQNARDAAHTQKVRRRLQFSTTLDFAPDAPGREPPAPTAAPARPAIRLAAPPVPVAPSRAREVVEVKRIKYIPFEGPTSFP